MPEIPETSSQTRPAEQKIDASKISVNNGGYKIVGTHLLAEYKEDDILQDIGQRIRNGRRLIIPIGLPQSGKSMFIASLIAYAFGTAKHERSCNFSVVGDWYASNVKTIIDALDKSTVLPTTTADYMTIIDIDMQSCYRGKSVEVTLIDFSGEDIERIVGIRPDDDQKSAAKIMKILSACVARKAIFAILSPIDEKMVKIGVTSDFDAREDRNMTSFINNLKRTNPKLYNMTKFLIILTKWDKLPNSISPERYLQKHRNTLYSEYSGYKRSYGLIPYSVGDVVGKTIIQISLRSPKNFWYTLYRWCTGKHVLPWWKRLFS
ncbi:MAG: hypothetical protein MJ001_03070 [Paludibacteraceae bacterium]|nr:hypothetical protein [Paludibacteraceae bacterium]